MSWKDMLGIVCTVAAAGSIIPVASAQEEIEVGGSVGADVVSAYIFRGGTINDEVNVNPFAEVSALGVTFGTWGNFNTDASEFDEIDYYVGYDLPLENAPVGISLGYTEYTFMGTDTLEADREFTVGFSAPEDTPLAPSLMVGVGFQGVLDDGLYFELGAGHAFPINDEFSIETGAALGYEAGDNFAENGFSHLTLSAGTSFGLFSFSVNYVIETDDAVQLVDEDFWVGVGFSL